jgi:hypothetical protein
MEEVLAMADINDMSSEAICAFLDMEADREPDVELYEDSILTEYFDEFLITEKVF